MSPMSPSIDPIAPWWLVALAGAGILGLTVWAYRKRLRGTTGAWRWFALGLRIAAVILCILAALKPSLVVMKKIKQTVAIVFLIDDSSSMSITDEADNRSRYDAARKALAEGQAAAKKLGDRLEVKTFRFDSQLREYNPKDASPPAGTLTAIGGSLDEVLKQTAGTRLAAIVLLSDGVSNSGPAPLQVAAKLKAQQVPVLAVGYGTESAGAASRDLVARDLVAGPLVFVKNEPAIRAVVAARGYPNQPIDVELYVEDARTPVATRQVQTREGSAVIPITDLKWTPSRPGETKLTLRVKPKEGELVPTNNEISTYVTVQSGGLSVLYLAGPGTVWEQKYVTRSLDASPEIQAKTIIIRRPVSEDPGVLPDEELTPGKHDVIILGDLAANMLTPLQIKLIRQCVEQKGAGLLMLGGRSSFGAGGWANTELAGILPTEIHPGDGQIEPPDGLKVVPNATGLENYVVRLGPSPAESLKIWESLPPIPGANRLGRARPNAIILAWAGEGEPLMVAQEVSPGRVLAFGGETWPWYTSGDESQNAHKKFWRQAILWLAHKEDAGSEQVKLTLDRRRVAVGQKLDMTVTARDAKGEPLSDVKIQTTVEPINPPGGTPPKAESVDVFNQGAEWRGSYFVTGQPGEYRVTTIGTRDGQEIGRDSARFLVYQDDREMENPAADFALLRQIMSMTGGDQLAKDRTGTPLKAEGLASAIRAIDLDAVVDAVQQKEVRLWDNWPFLLIFTALLTTEWWLRKRHGWV
jgi:uncharacterized membrane protein